MDLVFSILSGPRRDVAIASGWASVLRELAGIHYSLPRWVEQRADELCKKDAIAVLKSLPFKQLMEGMKNWLETAREREQLRFVAALERLNTPEAARLLTIALRFRSGNVRRVALGAIGSCKNSAALEVLVDLMKTHNDNKPDLGEVRQICALLARCQGAEGRTFLSYACRQRNGLFHRWRREIRTVARQALKRPLVPPAAVTLRNRER